MTTFAQPFQDYEILDRVGAGAMGTVFKALHKRLNRIVALKVLKPSLARDRRYVDRLRREARIVASLSHPNIVTGYDLGEEGGYHFFVMEFVEGKSLRQLLLEWGMFAEEYVLRVARQVAMALDHAYQRGVIHRDIKPGNILIDDKGDVKLTDMGLAKGPADLTLTRDGATVGTPQYISPEQARNPQDVDVRSDLYSLGATLYHMATGSPPFVGDTMAVLITKVLNDQPVPPDEANSAVSPGVSLVIRKLLAKNLQVRYQTPRELLDDLDRLAKREAPAVDLGRLQRDVRAPMRWWWPVLVGFAAAGLVIGAWWLGSRAPAPRPAETTPEEFVAQLDRRLTALSTPGQRLDLLGTITTTPSGATLAFEQRRRAVVLELQGAIDEVVAELSGAGWAMLEAWIEDPAQWPDRVRCERERLEPRVRAATGLTLAQLPGRVRLQAVEELRQAIDRAVERRDAGLRTRFDLFLDTTMPVRFERQLRIANFAAAERLWRDAITTFCNGVQEPVPERLAGPLLQALSHRHGELEKEALGELASAEQNLIAVLLEEVHSGVDDLGRRLAEGADPDVVGEALARFRAEIEQVWPDAARFRPGSDPWPTVERSLRSVQQQIDTAEQLRRGAAFEQRCDLAWRALCHGRSADALAVLADAAPATAAQAAELAGHRRALTAAAAAEELLWARVAAAERPPVAFLGTEPLELQVVTSGHERWLSGQAVGRPPQRLHWSELRLGDLMVQLGGDGVSPELGLGLCLLRLGAEDLGGIEALMAALPGAERTFVLDAVWPRLLQARGVGDAPPPSQLEVFAQLERAIADLAQGAPPSELERAIVVCTSRVPEGNRTPAQTRLLRRARRELELLQRQRDVGEQLTRSAVRGAAIDVRSVDGVLRADVSLAADVLRGDAGQGWQLHEGLLEYGGSSLLWADVERAALRARPGIEPTHSDIACEWELAFPGSALGRRAVVLVCKGVACALVVAANDTVHAVLVDGTSLRADNVQRATEKALAGAFETQASSSLVIAGALHRVRVEMHTTSARTRAIVVVRFEGRELLRQVHDVDLSSGGDAVLYPLQEVAVRCFTVTIEDL